MIDEPLTMIRLRLTPREVAAFERIGKFMRTRSLSQTVARMAVWNAEVLYKDLDPFGSGETDTRQDTLGKCAYSNGGLYVSPER